MRKLWNNNEPKLNKSGKVIKPKNWQPSDQEIINEIEKQSKEES